MTYYIVRTSGDIETRECAPLAAINTVTRAIGAELTTTVNLRDGRIMLVDDAGHGKHLPINTSATRLYWSVCKPGTHWQIRGDVAIVNDVDFDNSMHVTGFREKPMAPPAAPVIPQSGQSDEPTPYMVRCRTHGDVYLTVHEYDRQMIAADGQWVCPVCLDLATWDDANYETAMEKLTAPEQAPRE